MESITVLFLTNNIFHPTERELESVHKIVPAAEIHTVSQKEAELSLIQKAEIIFGWPDREQIQKAANLKWLHLPSAGADRYTDIDQYCNKDIVLTNSSGVFGLPIAEHVLSMILAFNRGLHFYFQNKEKKQWHLMETKKDFCGSTVGIIGLGDIGSEVAKRASAWGAKVIAVKRTLCKKPDYVDQLLDQSGIEYLLENSDYVVLALPNTAKTEKIISEKRLRMMKPDAFIVNIGRGSLIDQEALIKGLEEGWIAGAGLDVTTPEPLNEDNPLWKMPNVILTPHASGSSPTNGIRRFEIFNENLRRYMQRMPLKNLVDFDEGY